MHKTYCGFFWTNVLLALNREVLNSTCADFICYQWFRSCPLLSGLPGLNLSLILKVNHVEGQVLQNRINVDKAQYQNQNNKLRIEQAEKQIGELEHFELTVDEVKECCLG